MVVLAASVVTRSGKPLISRQFHASFSRSRLESLLISFTKMIPTGTQHTTMLSSDGTIRFVYQPVDELYVILLTPPLSNIILDIDTLHLIARIVSETCSNTSLAGRGSATEAEILRNSFELLSAFDEVVSLGYREKVGIGEVRAAMEMESHEERIQEIIARNKEMEAKEELKRRAKQLELQRREMLKRGQDPYGLQNRSMAAYERPYTPPSPVQHMGVASESAPSISSTSKPFKGKGLQLGASKSAKNNELLETLGGNDLGDYTSPFAQPAAPEPDPVPASPAPAAVPQARANPFDPVEPELVHLVVREKLSCELSKDGGLNSLELKGELDLTIADATLAKAHLSLAANEFGSDLQFKTHPNVDKNAWAKEKRLAVRDPKKGFPVNLALKVLRYRLATKDESIVPLNITCWPSTTGTSTEVNIEYELASDAISHLKNTVITIPLPPGVFPSISSVTGNHTINHEEHALEWQIDDISQDDEESKTGTLEFTVDSDDADAFFPIAVEFWAQSSLVGLRLESAELAESKAPIEASVDVLLQAEDYVVV